MANNTSRYIGFDPSPHAKRYDKHLNEWVMGPDNDIVTGPPAIDCIWHDMWCDAKVQTFRHSWYGTVDEIFCEIARAVQMGAYSLISVNASLYSVTVVFMTDEKSTDFWEAHPAADMEGVREFRRLKREEGGKGELEVTRSGQS